MRWGVYALFFWISTIKFMFAPIGGPTAKLSFIETYMSCVAGAIVSAAVFFFSSEFFLKRAHVKRKAAREAALISGIPLKSKKKFTRMNKFIVRIKRRFGIIGVSMYAPFFLSVPIGSVIAAKFYGKDKRTFPLIIFGMFFNGALTTGIRYGFDSFF
jgi:hypothetical protein